MKKRDMMMLSNALEGLNISNTSVKFKYLVSKNKMALKTEVETLRELFKDSSDDFKVYERKSMDLVNEFGVKDKEGNLIQGSNNSIPILPEKMGEFKICMEELQEDNRDLIDAENTRIREIENLLEEDVQGVTVEHFPLKVIPDEIPQDVMDVLINYIDEGGSSDTGL